MALDYVSDLELKKKLESDRLVVVLYSLERDADLKMSRILSRIAENRSNDAQFCAVKLSAPPERAQQHGVTATPLIRVFAGGKPVAQITGLQPRDAISREIDSIVSRPIEELKSLSHEELKVRIVKGEWGNALTSGIVAGAAFGFAMFHLKGVMTLLVPGAAIGFLILNENFRFSWQQKALAIALMLIVGFFGGDFLRWAFEQSNR